jgi:hypothetical protein
LDRLGRDPAAAATARRQTTAVVGLHAWGSPDLSPPSTSAQASAEVADLEALWRS